MFRVIPGPCLTVLLLCFSWGTWEATLQFLSQNWVKNKEPWWCTSKKHMLLFFVLENQFYFAHSLPCSPCVVLLDKCVITAPEGLIITLCCSSRATNPGVSWPNYLDPSIHQKQKPEGNVCFPFRDCQWLGRWDGEGCARTHRQALLHRCPSQKELKLI